MRKKLLLFITLSIFLPAMLLIAIEGMCRLFETDARVGSSLSSQSKVLELEMPRWMALDSNQQYRAARGRLDPNSLAWLSLFESGDQYRVRMTPNVEKRVINTFSQLSADRDHPYLIRSNSLGFRGSNIGPDKTAGTFRVLVFGDSSSFGWGVDQDDTFSALLARDLERNIQRLPPGTERVEVGNFAIPGDSSEYGRLVFERYAREFHPDLVILGFGANDAKPSPVSHVAQVEKFRQHAGLQRLRTLLSKSALYRTLERLMKPSPQNQQTNQLGPSKLKQLPAVPKKRYFKNLTAMITESFESGAKSVIVLTLCTPGDYAKVAKKAADANQGLFFNGQQFLIQQLESLEKGQLYPDKVAQLRGRYGEELNASSAFLITSDSCHPNEIGHQLVADQLSKLIFSQVEYQR